MASANANGNGNGHAVLGRPFKLGNPGGPGNPHGDQVSRIRASLMRTATPERMDRLHRRLFALAFQKRDWRLSLDATEAIMDRVHGKAPLNVNVNATVTELRASLVVALTDPVIAERLEEIGRGKLGADDSARQ